MSALYLLSTGKKTTKKDQSGDTGTAASAEADPKKTKAQLVKEAKKVKKAAKKTEADTSS